MRGCLSLPFRLLGLALLVLACYVGWNHRAEIRRRIHRWTAEGPAPAAPSVARPLPNPAEVLRRVEALRAGRSDSLVLSPEDLASLATELASRTVPGAVDSVEVRLDRDEIEVRGRVDTHKVPVSMGPLSSVVGDHEYLEAGGRLMFRRAGLAEWEVERVRIRGVPVPLNFVQTQIRRFAPRSGGSTIPVALPSGVTGLRVTSTGLTLYGPTRGRGAP